MNSRQRMNIQNNQTVEAFTERFENNLYYHRGLAIQSASLNDKYMALAYTVRDYLIDRWRKTVDNYYQIKAEG